MSDVGSGVQHGQRLENRWDPAVWRPLPRAAVVVAPEDRFVFHAAGLAGRGSSSYIGAVIMRDQDAKTAWDAASDATLEERRYYCQNSGGGRADVVALLSRLRTSAVTK